MTRAGLKLLRAAIYARVSSIKQRDTESIQSQLGALHAYVERQGWTLAGVYVDDGKTAKTGALNGRDGFARLAADAEAGLFDVLVVFDIKRLTRTGSIEERAQIIGPFQRLGIPIHSPAGGEQNLRSFFGETYVMLQALFGAEENRQRADAVISGKQRAIEANRKPAGPTPYGLSYSRADGWSVNVEQQAICIEILERIVAGESCRAIGEVLADRGLRRPRGGEWSWERVWQVATSRSLTGSWFANKEQGLALKVPAVVPEQLWYAAQDALNRHRLRGLKKTKHVYLLESIADCQVCGAPIVISSHGRGMDGPYPRSGTYACTWRRRPKRGCPACELPHRKISVIDPLVWQEIKRTIEARDFVERLVETRRAALAEARRQVTAINPAALAAELARLVEVERVIVARFRRGLISEDVMDGELAAGRHDRMLLERQIAAGQRARPASGKVEAKMIGELALALRARLPRASLSDRRDLTQALLGEHRVVIGAQEITATARFPVGSVLAVGSNSSHETKDKNLRYIALPLRVAA